MFYEEFDQYELVLFSVLMTVSLGGAYAEEQNASNNISKVMSLNNNRKRRQQ